MIRGAFNYLVFLLICFPAICVMEVGLWAGGRKFRTGIRELHVQYIVRRMQADIVKANRRSGTKPKRRRK